MHLRSIGGTVDRCLVPSLESRAGSWVMLSKVWWHTHGCVQFKWSASTSCSLEVNARGQEVPWRYQIETSSFHLTPRNCVSLVMSCVGVNFPEITPFLGYVVKEKCSLNQIDGNPWMSCESDRLHSNNTGVSRSLLFCFLTNYRNKTSHHDQRTTLGSSCLNKRNFSLSIRLKNIFLT